MRPADSRLDRRTLRLLAVAALVALALFALRALGPGAPDPMTAVAAGARPLAQGNDNCIINTSTIPATPLPTATTNPTASAGGPYAGTVGQPILFHGAGTPARYATILTCLWNFGDNTGASFLTPTHVYALPGTYTATLTITDTSGAMATSSATVSVAPFQPLCQQPALTGNSNLNTCQVANACTAASAALNNGCMPVCPQTGEALVPGNCPGPATGNQIIINGPFQIQVLQPFTVNANLNLPAFSDLANADTITFDFGDRTIVTNAGTGSAGSLVTTSSTSGSTTSSTTGVAGVVPFSPAVTNATHAYSQAGTYTITVTATFADGTRAVAQTMATVTGGMALPQALATPVSTQQTITLAPGCNTVTLAFPDGTGIVTVAAAVQGTQVIAIYETPPNAPALGYFPDPRAPSNLVSVRHGDTASICVRGAGTLVEPAT